VETLERFDALDAFLLASMGPRSVERGNQ